jgi:glycosyltransferase involved in cell wall biosynthesis
VRALNVALVVPGGVDAEGERVIPAVLWLVERLAARHEVRIYTLDTGSGPSEFPLLGAVVERLPAGRPRFAVALPGLVRSLRAHGPFDVLHAFWADTPGLLAAAAAKFVGAQTILHLGGGELAAREEIGWGGALSWRGRLRTRLAVRGATRVTAASRFLVELASARGVAAEEVPLGVPREWTERAGSAPAAPPFTLAQVASLNRVKDQPTLLRAFRRVLDAGADARLEIAGEDTLSGEVQRLARSLSLGDRVVFHGRLPSGRVGELLSRAHLHVVSSRHEAGPVAAVEAAALGVPTVGTAVGHVADWAPALASAVPVGDDAALARAILELLGDPARRAAMGARARDWARTHDADATADAFTRIYEEVVRARGGRGSSGSSARA